MTGGLRNLPESVGTVTTRTVAPQLAAGEDGTCPAPMNSWLEKMCPHISDGVLAREAAELLANPDRIPEMATMVVLPIWRWMLGAPSTGRKANRTDGVSGVSMMPSRVAWAAAIVLVEPGKSVTANWKIRNLDRDLSGAMSLHAGTDIDEVFAGWDGPVQGSVRTLGRTRLVRALEKIVADGKTSRWKAWATMEAILPRLIDQSMRSVSGEIFSHVGPTGPLLDETQIAQIVTRMSVGEEGKDGSLSQIWDLILRPTCFARADPLLYIRTNIRRAARYEVQRAIGDPQQGKRIRMFGKQYLLDGGIPTAEGVLAAYQAEYPSDQLGMKRLLAAMTTPHFQSGTAMSIGPSMAAADDSLLVEDDQDDLLFDEDTAA